MARSLDGFCRNSIVSHYRRPYHIKLRNAMDPEGRQLEQGKIPLLMRLADVDVVMGLT